MLNIPSPPAPTQADVDEAQLLEAILTESHHPPPTRHPPPFLTPDLDLRLAQLPKDALDSLNHLVLFPHSFSVEAAQAVMGLSPCDPSHFSETILQPLADVKLLRELAPGRFQLNDITKSVVSAQSFLDASGARQRFVAHFLSKLRPLDPRTLSASAAARKDAIRLYDLERRNMTVALQMCRDMGGRELLLEFLTAAATVLRYSTPAQDRVRLFGDVVAELDSFAGRVGSAKAESRVRLAYAEALFDMLRFDEAEGQLGIAIGKMAGAGEGFDAVTSALALVLLAELRISEGQFAEGRKVLMQALRTLTEAGMQKSSFGAACWLGLCSVYMGTSQLENAVRSGKAGMDMLRELGFSEMAIYAGGLRVLGGAHMRQGEVEQAQRLFFSGLGIFENWMGRKEWSVAPVEHCLSLDVCLAESIAQTYLAQGRRSEADRFGERARQQRIERGISGQGSRDGKARVYTRHLY